MDDTATNNPLDNVLRDETVDFQDAEPVPQGLIEEMPGGSEHVEVSKAPQNISRPAPDAKQMATAHEEQIVGAARAELDTLAKKGEKEPEGDKRTVSAFTTLLEFAKTLPRSKRLQEFSAVIGGASVALLPELLALKGYDLKGVANVVANVGPTTAVGVATGNHFRPVTKIIENSGRTANRDSKWLKAADRVTGAVVGGIVGFGAEALSGVAHSRIVSSGVNLADDVAIIASVAARSALRLIKKTPKETQPPSPNQE